MANAAVIQPASIRVWGMDLENRPFVEHVFARNISAESAILDGRLNVKTGDILGVQLRHVRAHCRVAWVGEIGSIKAGLVGVQLLDKKELWASIAPADPAPTAAGPPAVPRSQERFKCAGSVEVRSPESRFPIHCGLADISLSGCYIETTHPLPSGANLDLELRLAATSPIRARAVVRTSYPLVGMGVQFLEIPPEHFPRLLSYLQIQERRRQQELAQAGGRSDDGREAAVLQHAIEEVLEKVHGLQTRLTAASLDERLLHPLRQSVLHTRVLLALATQWITRQQSHQDPVAVMPALNTEVTAVASSLLHELTRGLRAGSIQLDGSSLDQLRIAVADLAESLHATSQ